MLLQKSSSEDVSTKVKSKRGFHTFFTNQKKIYELEQSQERKATHLLSLPQQLYLKPYVMAFGRYVT